MNRRNRRTAIVAAATTRTAPTTGMTVIEKPKYAEGATSTSHVFSRCKSQFPIVCRNFAPAYKLVYAQGNRPDAQAAMHSAIIRTPNDVVGRSLCFSYALRPAAKIRQ